jgi:hypothetical protein
MSKQTLTIALVAIALVVPLAGQNGKPPRPPATATCTIQGEVDSQGSPVTVGRDVQTYGPMDQVLYIDESLLPSQGAGDPTGGIALVKGAPLSDGYYGPYYGQIRVLNDRIDYFFDTAPGCAQDNTAPNLCPFRLVVVDGTAVYSGAGKRKTLVGIAFNDGRYLLDYRPCDPAVDPVNCYFKLLGCYDDRDCPGVPPDGPGYLFATFDVRFQ